jgi:hypothetical protein
VAIAGLGTYQAAGGIATLASATSTTGSSLLVTAEGVSILAGEASISTAMAATIATTAEGAVLAGLAGGDLYTSLNSGNNPLHNELYDAIQDVEEIQQLLNEAEADYVQLTQEEHNFEEAQALADAMAEEQGRVNMLEAYIDLLQGLQGLLGRR